MAQNLSNDVDPLYYLHNFNQLMETISTLHLDLLRPQDLKFLEHYRQLETDAQQLYVRLICRRANFFRLDKLTYPEIGSLDNATDLLSEHELLKMNPNLTAIDISNLLTAKELKAALQIKGSPTKSALTDTLISELGDTAVEHSVWQRFIPVPVLFPHYRDSLERFRLIYFGNLYQDLSQFVVSDLGIMQFENYPLDQNTRAFNRTEDVDRYLLFDQINQQLEDAVLPNDEQLKILLCPMYNQRLELKRNRLIKAVGQQLERNKNLSAAAELYASASLPPNRERHVRTLFNQQLFEQALDHCHQLAEQPLSADEEMFCKSFTPRILRKLGGPVVRRPTEQFNSEQLVLDDDGQRVELQVITHYRALGYDGIWCENELFNTLFGLLFWQQIFAPLEGAFSHPYQQAPLDFNSPAFSQRRHRLFQNRLQQLHKVNLLEEIAGQYSEHLGIANPFINWKRCDPAHISLLCQRIPQHKLLMIMEKICFDPQAYRSGFPDLFLWHSASDDYLLVEVKGPGDQLQNSQKRWLRLFDSFGIQYQISWVTRPT
ncbi:VRR-NUC domain-containing protein [Pontibacterium sp. N1Y112]|uniref:phosphodiesterase I n=1 Tax=Pontibacterium sinense TaxID=2781979 RepID=A0A8J7FAT5_9GAMM|nr:VRR-NUC domain-containing protein [Pontibacterium sinense]MBE9397532.1 VRR-NUC domain-containing protein [Pontibacterium sinense]